MPRHVHIPVDMSNEDDREVLPMLALFLNEFTKAVCSSSCQSSLKGI
jgi:hypothetical protein